MVKQSVFLIVALPLIFASARADFHYQQREGVTVYIATGEEPAILSRLPEINYQSLKRLVNLSHPKQTRSLTEINPDEYDCDEYRRCQHAYLSDGRYILWAGKIVQNTGDEPGIDPASFQAFDAFASDKHSLYFDGERSDDNYAAKRVDMTTLVKTEVPYLLRDKNSLYFKGRWLGSADGFQVLHKASVMCGPDSAFIALTEQQVIVNGVPLVADVSTFQVVQWMPGEWLIYRDKNGEHEFRSGDSERRCEPFNIGLKEVTWLKHRATNAGTDCKVATLEGVDPEYFYRLNSRVGWYKDRIYIVNINALGEGELRILAPQELSLGQDNQNSQFYYSNLYFSADGQLFRNLEDGSWQRYNPRSATWILVSQMPLPHTPLYSREAH